MTIDHFTEIEAPRARPRLSSIGGVYPPVATDNERLRGFYNRTVTDPTSLDAFEANYEQQCAAFEAADALSRLSIRLIVSHAMVRHLRDLEAAVPFVHRGIPYALAYVGYNKPGRAATTTNYAAHQETIQAAMRATHQPASIADTEAQHGLHVGMLDYASPPRAREALARQLAVPYQVFGFDSDETQHIMSRPPYNTIAHARDGAGSLVSVAVAEHYHPRLPEVPDLRLLEITWAYTEPSHRGKGIYQALSGMLVRHLSTVYEKVCPVIFGEANLASSGVLRAASANGRCFNVTDAAQFGVDTPSFGILPQHTRIGEHYQDFALTYSPRP